MATSNVSNDQIEACFARALRSEYPHMETTDVNELASSVARFAAREIKRYLKAEWRSSAGARKFDFLDLPAEIRNFIYEYVVIPDSDKAIGIGRDSLGHIHLMQDVQKRWEDGAFGTRQQEIARVSRQLCREALPMFYGLNTFMVSLEEPPRVGEIAIHGPEKLAKWLKAIGPINIAYLRKMKVIHRRTTGLWMEKKMSPSEFEGHENVCFDHVQVEVVEQDRPL